MWVIIWVRNNLLILFTQKRDLRFSKTSPLEFPPVFAARIRDMVKRWFPTQASVYRVTWVIFDMIRMFFSYWLGTLGRVSLVDVMSVCVCVGPFVCLWAPPNAFVLGLSLVLRSHDQISGLSLAIHSGESMFGRGSMVGEVWWRKYLSL